MFFEDMVDSIPVEMAVTGLVNSLGMGETNLGNSFKCARKNENLGIGRDDWESVADRVTRMDDSS